MRDVRIRPVPTPEFIALGFSLLLVLAATFLPLWLVPTPELRLEIWLYAGAALGPLTLAALAACVLIGRRRAQREVDPEGFYRTLGIDPRVARAMPEEQLQALLTRQYRLLARQHHPDVTRDSTQMSLINRAYTELKDPEKRRRYVPTRSPV
jgi:DnaJ domain